MNERPCVLNLRIHIGSSRDQGGSVRLVTRKRRLAVDVVPSRLPVDEGLSADENRALSGRGPARPFVALRTLESDQSSLDGALD